MTCKAQYHGKTVKNIDRFGRDNCLNLADAKSGKQKAPCSVFLGPSLFCQDLLISNVDGEFYYGYLVEIFDLTLK